jgi:hypothetical protein
MGARGPIDWRTAAREGFGGTQWSDNVARMHLFMRAYPQVTIRTPLDSGTGQFTARWPEGEASDSSLAGLMDELERIFEPPAPGHPLGADLRRTSSSI